MIYTPDFDDENFVGRSSPDTRSHVFVIRSFSKNENCTLFYYCSIIFDYEICMPKIYILNAV